MSRPIMMKPSLVILDRDGVINYDSDAYIKTPDEWLPIEGSLAAIGSLQQLGIPVAVATNQGGVGRGILSATQLTAIHAKMIAALAQHNAEFGLLCSCVSPDRNHPDYKPNPGMLYKILAHFGCDPQQVPVYFVGDKLSDIEAGIRANCLPVLVKTGKGQQSLQTLLDTQHPLSMLLRKNNLLICEDLADFVRQLQLFCDHKLCLKKRKRRLN